jgi:hypothetical protein
METAAVETAAIDSGTLWTAVERANLGRLETKIIGSEDDGKQSLEVTILLSLKPTVCLLHLRNIR